ncbi:S1 family peptidase [Kitasatospora purpeofusca]|uniref:S1 family peptidase n=1 Tax=Kitasatospora purpeofusca TaxID=67352 RepID=UPI003870A0D8|nr:S1 family peptidase [Kitasatospora purpeofusca]
MTTTLIGAALLVLLPTAPADAAGSVRAVHGAGVPVTGVLARQEALDRLADEITRVPEHERALVPGYAGHTVDPRRGHLDLYWHGGIPDRVTSVLAAAPTGITSAVHEAPYSLRELRAGRDRLVGAVVHGEAGAVWTSAGPVVDGSGLTVTYTPDTPDTADTPDGARRHGAAIAGEMSARAAELAGVPVTAVVAAASVATATRHSDASPWSAGAELTTPGNGWCTSGFGGWRGTTAVLLTASHCGTSGTYRTGAGAVVGTAADSDTGLDTTVVDVTGSPSGKYFDGGWDDGTGFAKRVVGAGRNNVGDLVCASGAMSGVHCSLRITATDVAAEVNGQWRTDLDTATRTDDSTVAVAKGDSGGPVVASVNGGADMQARGIISAGTGNPVVCGSVAAQTTCWDSLRFVPIGPIVSKFGLSLA